MPRYERTGPKGVELIDIRIAGMKITTAKTIRGKTTKKKTTYTSTRMSESRFQSAIVGYKQKGFAHVSTLRTGLTNPELERAIAANPDSLDARSIYGDWLEEQGDPRGALIAIQRELAPLKLRGAATVTALRKREAALLAEHSSEFFGVLDELLHIRHTDRPLVRVEWRAGFMDEVEIRLSEGGMPWFPTVSAAVACLAKLPTAHFVRRLVLGGSLKTYQPALAEVAKWPGTLRSLRITGQLWGEYTPGGLKLGSLAAVCAAHPALDELELAIEQDPLDGLSLPNLRVLDLWTNQLMKKQLAAVARATWPKLETFGLAIGSSAYAKPDLVVADLAALLDAKLFPALTTLRLGRILIKHAGALATLLAASTLARKLTSIVLVNAEAGAAEIFEAMLAPAKIPVAREDRET